jgi:hypothetical protein
MGWFMALGLPHFFSCRAQQKIEKNSFAKLSHNGKLTWLSRIIILIGKPTKNGPFLSIYEHFQ